MKNYVFFKKKLFMKEIDKKKLNWIVEGHKMNQ